MAQRPDTILHDMTSEGYGGSAYHNTSLNTVGVTASAGAARSNWIAFRKVRIINSRVVVTGPLGSGSTGQFNRYANAGSSAPTAAIIAPLVTTISNATALTLSTASTGGEPNVVVDQYGRVELYLVGPLASASGNNLCVAFHYAFED